MSESFNFSGKDRLSYACYPSRKRVATNVDEKEKSIGWKVTFNLRLILILARLCRRAHLCTNPNTLPQNHSVWWSRRAVPVSDLVGYVAVIARGPEYLWKSGHRYRTAR
jgi:hypothetical protein